MNPSHGVRYPGAVARSWLRCKATDGSPLSFVAHGGCADVSVDLKLAAWCLLRYGRVLLFVCIVVLQHVVLTNESLATAFARIRLRAAVQTHVAPKVRLVVKLLWTKLAFERFFAAMFG